VHYGHSVSSCVSSSLGHGLTDGVAIQVGPVTNANDGMTFRHIQTPVPAEIHSFSDDGTHQQRTSCSGWAIISIHRAFMFRSCAASGESFSRH